MSPLLLLLALCIVFILQFFRTPGTSDVTEFFLPWFRAVHQYGVQYTYARADSGYPPLPFIILRGADVLREMHGLTFETAFKFSLLLPWLTVCGFVLFISRNLALTSAATLAFGWNSVALGYIDIWSALFLVPALYLFVRGQYLWFSAAFTLAVFTKFQPLIAAPFLAMYLARSASPDARATMRRVVVCLVSVTCISLPLLIFFSKGLLRAFVKSLHHPFLSGNALNANWVLAWALHEWWPVKFGANTQAPIGLILTYDWRVTLLPNCLFWAIFGALLRSQWRRSMTLESALAHASCALLAYCTFKTGVHENHWIYPVVFLAVLAARVPAARPYFIFWAFAATFNLFLFYGMEGHPLPYLEVVGGVHTSVLAALLYVSAFFASLPLCRDLRTTDEYIARAKNG